MMDYRPPRPGHIAGPHAAQRGFTIPELLVALLLASALIALSFWVAHPIDFTARDHNAARWTDVSQLMQATRKYAADNNGALPAGLPDTAKPIGDAKDMVDLCKAFVPKYMKDIPLDPIEGGQYAVGDCRGTASSPGKYVTGYTIVRAADGTVTIAAPAAEDGKTVRLSHKF